MSAATSEPRSQAETLAETVIKEHCKQLHLPAIAGQCARLAEQAEREHHSYLGYLDVLLQAELEERERNTIARRLKDAHLPRVKTLDEFDFSQAPAISPAQIQALAEGGYIERAEPVVLIGECGTGKTHLLTALCVAACRQRRRVRCSERLGNLGERATASASARRRTRAGRRHLPPSRRRSARRLRQGGRSPRSRRAACPRGSRRHVDELPCGVRASARRV